MANFAFLYILTSFIDLHDQLREQDGPHEQVGVPQSSKYKQLFNF